MTIEPHVLICHDRRLLRALEFVARDLTRRPALAEVARAAGFERSYFSRRFRKAMGIGFAAWSTHLRIARAIRLLSIRDLPISGIAAAVGYGDVTTFERNFRKHVHLSPSECRNVIALRAAMTKNATFAETNTINAETANSG